MFFVKLPLTSRDKPMLGRSFMLACFQRLSSLFVWSTIVNRTFKVSLARAVVASATLAFASVSVAGASGTLTPTITVKGHVSTNCTSSVTQPSTIEYDPIVTNASGGVDDKPASTGSLVLNCTKNAAVTIDLNQGANATGTTPNFVRNMLGARTTPDKLAYQIYSDSAFSVIWGTTSGGTSPVSVTGLGPGVGNQLTEPLYIEIPKGQNVASDNYVDTVTATITY